ncbi:hypothetical protein V2J09_014772 [Rumex salicifolius]
MQVAGAITELLVTLPSAGGYRFRESRSCHFYPDCKPSCLSFGISKAVKWTSKHRMRGFVVRASVSPEDSVTPVAPVQMESPIGQLLEQILQTHPHLLPAAIDQQLEQLKDDRDAKKEESTSSPLYKRIAEVKEKERKKTLEEILYCIVVQKFLENDIVLIPKIMPSSDPIGRVDFWPNQEMKLESIHSSEAYEMIQAHLELVLGDRLVGPLQNVVEMSKIKLGKLYAASIMYGYFLRRVDQRFQLERSMKTLPKEFTEKESRLDAPPSQAMWGPDSPFGVQPEESSGPMYAAGGGDDHSNKLRSYVMYLDADTLQRYATIRSGEAVSLIEKQTQALFGRPDIKVKGDGSLETGKDEMLVLTFSGLTMLVLEAVAFGSFLWDAEDYVESKYQFIGTI